MFSLNITVVTRVVLGFVLMAVMILGISIAAGFDQWVARKNMATFTDEVTPELITGSGLITELLSANKAVNQHASTTDPEVLPVLAEQFAQAIQRFQQHAEAMRGRLRNAETTDLLNQAEAQAQAAFTLGYQQLEIRNTMLAAEQTVATEFESFNAEWLFFEDDLKMVVDDLVADENQAGQWSAEYILKNGVATGLTMFMVPGIKSIEKLNEIVATQTERFNNIEGKYKDFQKNSADYDNSVAPHMKLLRKAVVEEQGLMQQQLLWLTARNESDSTLGQMAEKVNQSQASLDQLNQLEVQYANQVSNNANQQMQTALNIILLALVSALALSFLVGWNVVLSVRKPLKQTIKTLDDLAQGDVTQRIEVIREDEFGRIGQAINQMGETLNKVINDISQGSKQLADVADQTHQTSKNSKVRAEDQRQRTDSVATAVTEMESAIAEVAQNAEGTAMEVKSVNQNSLQNKAKVDANIESIKQLKAELSEASETVNLLSEASNRIGTILEVIQSIAEQTNLLALNAAIEAARAGEQGRGFAVVADEVRNLASKTQSSTEEIYGMIDNLQKRSADTVTIMDRSQSQAESCVAQAADTGEALDIMLTNLEHIDQLSSSIATAAEEQSAVAKEVAQNVVQIADLAEDSANEAEVATNNSDKVNHLAGHLKKLVSQFKTH